MAELKFCSGKAETEIVENKFEVEDISEMKWYNSFFLNNRHLKENHLYIIIRIVEISILLN